MRRSAVMSTYERSLFEVFDEKTREQLEKILWDQAVPSQSVAVTFPKEPDRYDAFDTKIVEGNVVAFVGKLWDDTLTINKGAVVAFKPGKVLVDRTSRVSRYGLDKTRRKVWVAERKVIKLNQFEYRVRYEEML